MYYQHAGSPSHYVWNWDGLPPGPTHSAEQRELSGDYIDVTATFHKSLGDYPVAMSLMSGKKSILHSGPEQTHIYDGLGAFDKGQKLALLAGVGIVGYLLWKKSK